MIGRRNKASVQHWAKVKALGVAKKRAGRKERLFGLAPGERETVEQFLARGGTVTACPVAFVLPSIASVDLQSAPRGKAA